MTSKRKVTNELIQLCKERMEPYACTGFLMGAGKEDAEIMLVGEAPGRQEVIENRPFIGKAGQVMDDYFTWLGLTREDVYITSVIRSRPYQKTKPGYEKPIDQRGNRTPNQAEILAHAPLLDAQIEEVDPKVIVTLGGVAFRRLTGMKERLTDVHGTPFQANILQVESLESNRYIPSDKTYTIFPTFHPASIFYNQKLKAAIEDDMRALKDYLTTSEIK
ncbi:uracil-DNA glycosylase [Alkalihalobacillus sp. FSL R5-0424]